MESHVNTLNSQNTSSGKRKKKDLKKLINSNRFIYTIQLSHELCAHLAEEMGLDIFNKKHNF